VKYYLKNDKLRFNEIFLTMGLYFFWKEVKKA